MPPPPQWPAADYDDNHCSTTAAPVGVPIFESPIPLTTAKYVFTQEWQGPADFAAVKLNTPHPTAGQVPDYSSYLLVEEGPRRDVGGGQVRWTRTYAQVPASYSIFESFPNSFIGTEIVTSGGVIITRDRQNWTVPSRIQFDYFLTPNPGDPPINAVDPITLDTVSLSSPGDIEVIQDMIYCFQNTLNGVIYGGITLSTNVINPSNSTDPTWPSSNDYLSNMMADALANRWKSKVTMVKLFTDNNLNPGGHMAGVVDTAASVQGGQIPAEPCRLDLWKGNIWVRRTRYVLAR